MSSVRTKVYQVAAVGGLVLTGYAYRFISRKRAAAKERRIARQNYWEGILLGLKFAASAVTLGGGYYSYRSLAARFANDD